jgi:hypothetical protein
MGAESNAIAEHIRLEREELGRDIRELDALVRREPQRWLEENLWRIAGAAFGAFLLIGFLMTSRRHRRY